jgi:hypothetical protein
MSDILMSLMMHNQFAYFSNIRKVLIGACVATAALWTFNRVMDRRLANAEAEEEAQEQEEIRLLKEKLPKNILARYGMSKAK